MKLNKKWIFDTVFLFGASSFLTFLIGIFWYHKIIALPPVASLLIFIVFTLMIICTFALAIENIFNGSKYFEKIKIPIEEFEIVEYENVYIVSCKNYAWAMNKRFKKVLNRKIIKAIQYYNRDKTPTSYWIDIPHLAQK